MKLEIKLDNNQHWTAPPNSITEIIVNAEQNKFIYRMEEKVREFSLDHIKEVRIIIDE